MELEKFDVFGVDSNYRVMNRVQNSFREDPCGV